MTRTAFVFLVLAIFAVIVGIYKIIGISLGAIKSIAIISLAAAAVGYLGNKNVEREKQISQP